MNYENFRTGHNKPTIITAEQYGTKVSVELDHSDTDIDELFDVFETLITGLGYHKDSWKQWILDRADEYREEDNMDITTPYTYEDFKRDEELENLKKLNNDFFGKMDESEKRMDIIGQNGNEGLHYRATQEDEDEFSDDGGFDGKPHFEWGDEPEDDINLFEGDEWQANEKLKAANERYKHEVKKMNTKKRKAKSVKDWEDNFDLGGNE